MEANENKHEPTINRKVDFMLKKKLFDNAPQTIESLMGERKDLYTRLQLSRDELDSYIRYMHRMCDDKGKLHDELSTLKASNETLTLKCKRLEHQNKLLVKESSELMQMLAEFGPNELYNFSEINPNTEEAITKKLKESVQVIFDENRKLHQEQDLLKNELRDVTIDLNESHKKVNDLTKKVQKLEEVHEEDQSLKLEYESLSREHSKCFSNSNKINTTGNMATNDQFYSINSTPASFHIFQGDSSSVLNSTYNQNSFNVDIFDKFPYKLQSFEVYSDSEGQSLEDKSFYISANQSNNPNQNNSLNQSNNLIQHSSLLYDTAHEINSQNNKTTDSNKTNENDKTIESYKTADSNKTIDNNAPEQNLMMISRKTSSIDMATMDMFGLSVSIRGLHQTVRSLLKLMETLKDDAEKSTLSSIDTDDGSALKMEEFINVTDSNPSQTVYENLNYSLDTVKEELVQLSELLTKMSSDFTDVRDENAMLVKEISALKYALTCRIELKNSRKPQPAHNSNSTQKTNGENTVNPCNCEEKATQFNEQRATFEQTIAELHVKIEELTEERGNLFDLITQIANSSDSGNE